MKIIVKKIYYVVAVLSSVLLFSSCSKPQSKNLTDDSNQDNTNDSDINHSGTNNSDTENNLIINNKTSNKQNEFSEERNSNKLKEVTDAEHTKKQTSSQVQDEFQSEILLQDNSAEVSNSSAETPLSSPKIIVKKNERILELWNGDSLYDSYPIGLGFSPEGDKTREGDGRTPIGTYYVCTRNSNSRFYLSLGISYPNKEDASTALEEGRIDELTYNQIVDAIDSQVQPPWNTPLGGEIMIHGMGSDSDWTAGCVAVDNHVMDILWTHVKLKTPIEILP